MKIYQVIYADYEGQTTFATLTSRELADEYVAKAVAAKVGEVPEVVEIEVTDVAEPKFYFTVGVAADGSVENENASIQLPWVEYEDTSGDYGDGTGWAHSTRSMGHAIKLAKAAIRKAAKK